MRRNSLVVRLLVVIAVVAITSVVGTAWLASTTASRFDLQKFGENQEADMRILDELTGYAATHSNWDTVAPFIEKLSTETGRRIALRGTFDVPIADTKQDVFVPDGQSVDVDPLSTAFTADGLVDGEIDARVVGPYRLTAAERSSLDEIADRVAACIGNGATVTHLASGRPVIDSDRRIEGCAIDSLARPVPTEKTALNALLTSVNACLVARGVEPVDSIATDFTAGVRAEAKQLEAAVQECIYTARAEQLQPWVAPPITATMTDAVGDQRGPLDLTRGSVARIALISAGILALILGVALAVGTPIIRRVRALTVAAERMADGETGTQVPVKGRDEIARLGEAFNEMSRQRERNEQLRTQLISDVAHELRTPLTNLLGWLEAAEDGVAEYDASLNANLLNETKQLTRIVADLQTLTLADAGGLRLRQDDLDLAGLLATVVESHARRARADGVELRLDVANGLELHGDGGRIRQVVDNLVANALDHTPRGGVVTVSAGTHLDRVLIRVADTGVGISSADLPSIFERFWRADRSRARVSGGSGLGLSIVRKLVEAHGGTVSATSELGNGTVVTVELPASVTP